MGKACEAQTVYLSNAGFFTGLAAITKFGAYTANLTSAVPFAPIQAKGISKAAALILQGIELGSAYGATVYAAKAIAIDQECTREIVREELERMFPSRPRNGAGAGGGGGGSGGTGASDGGYAVGGKWVYVEVGIDGYTSSGWRWVQLPIAFDLDGDGIEWKGLGEPLVADLMGDGRAMKRAWIGSDDGLLVFDVNRNNIGSADEWALTSFVPGATSDLEALRFFDTNNDGVFDALDAQFVDFKVGRDINQNGYFDVGEMQTLAAMGIKQINLRTGVTVIAGDDARVRPLEGVGVSALGQYVRTDGTTGTFADASLAAQMQSTVILQDANFVITSSGSKNALWSMSTGPISVTMSTFSYGGHGRINDVMGGAAADSIVGNGNGNLIIGGGGRDTLLGGAGDDVILTDYVAVKTGRISGGDGIDTLALTTNHALALDAARVNVEVIFGGSGNDRFWSTATIDFSTGDGVTFFGNAGNDSLTGTGGNDILVGGVGSDTLLGGDGGDTIFMDAEDNLANIRGNGTSRHNGIDTLVIDSATGINIANLFAIGFENVDGGDGNDSIRTWDGDYLSTSGDAHDNMLSGGRGNDTLDGGFYNDTYMWKAGDGHDRFIDVAAGSDADVVIVDDISIEDINVVNHGGVLRLVFDDGHGGGSVQLSGFLNGGSSPDILLVDDREYRIEDVARHARTAGASGRDIMDLVPIRSPDNPNGGQGEDPGDPGDPGNQRGGTVVVDEGHVASALGEVLSMTVELPLNG